MNEAKNSYRKMLASVPADIKAELRLGRRPSEITKWLSGQHNFTLSTLEMLSSFFGQPIITVG